VRWTTWSSPGVLQEGTQARSAGAAVVLIAELVVREHGPPSERRVVARLVAQEVTGWVGAVGSSLFLLAGAQRYRGRNRSSVYGPNWSSPVTPGILTNWALPRPLDPVALEMVDVGDASGGGGPTRSFEPVRTGARPADVELELPNWFTMV
jgi:hypothetical protein